MQQPVKRYDPLEPITVSLTWAEWDTVLQCLEHNAESHRARMVEILANIKDPTIRGEWAAEQEKSAAEKARLAKIIEAALTPQPPTEPE